MLQLPVQAFRQPIETAMSPLWRERCATVASRYASMNTAERIAEILKNVDLTIEKRFVDL